MLAGSELASFTNLRNGRTMNLMVTVTEVKAGNAHALVDHLNQALDRPAARSNGANNLGFLAIRIIRILELGQLLHVVSQNDVGLTINASISRANHLECMSLFVVNGINLRVR